MMFVCLFCWCFYLLTEAILNTEKCWKTTDMRTTKHGFIHCPNSTIIVKNIRLDEGKGYRNWRNNTCRSVDTDSYMNKLLKCNGLYGVCGVHDVDILAVLKEYADNCDWNIYRGYPPAFLRVCIIYDCIHGQMNNLMYSTTVTKARGSVYQAVQLKGFLRCAILGHITNITVIGSNSLRLLVRDEDGDEILHFVGTSSSPKTPLFVSTKNAINKDALEVSMYTEDDTDVTLIVEGGMHYYCRNTTLGLGSNHQAENGTEIDEIYCYCQNVTFGLESNHQTKHRTEFDRDNIQMFSVSTIPWILASIFMTLSLVLTIICVTLCLLWRKNKTVIEESPENEIPSDLLCDNPQQSYFESEMYMENRF